MHTVLVFDAGKTGCRAGLWVDGSRVGYVDGPGASGITEPDGVEQALAAMAEAAAALASVHPLHDVTSVVAGLAGLWSAPEHAATLRDTLGQRYPRATVLVTSDIIISHAGALSGRPGVVLAAGTGVSVLAVSEGGGSSLVDGWGYLLGDAGSGYAIGRSGLDQALRQADGRGGSAALLERLVDRTGAPRRLPREVHGAANPARVIASFARDVFAAALDGDGASLKICDDAAKDLAGSVAAAVREARVERPVSIATTGGLLNAGEVLTAPLDHHLAEFLPGATRRSADGDALDGGYVMARRPGLPHGRLLPGGETDEKEGRAS